jgi:hypothetical protein
MFISRSIALASLIGLLLTGCGERATEKSNSGKKAAIPKVVATSEWTEFPEPITIVASSGFLDGGTTYVCLKDSRGRLLWVCVSTKFDDGAPPHTLFLDADHYLYSPTARLPYSEKEAALAVDSLQKALTAALSPEQLKQLEANEGLSDDAPDNDNWTKMLAFDAFKRLSKHERHDFLDAKGSNPPGWYADYQRERKSLSEQGLLR